ncbi:hypothetical protein CDAR_23121 [Caerostris darwini]|uniref:Uncharacterized protein n=1 Tax=Caerostris darwini TaxID=1538125 RepID=A0AAV4QB12_9ARAC|nr:hypothetical protein CDAR_23121 [Caerostris darwini]
MTWTRDTRIRPKDGMERNKKECILRAPAAFLMHIYGGLWQRLKGGLVWGEGQEELLPSYFSRRSGVSRSDLFPTPGIWSRLSAVAIMARAGRVL